jgi:hypothetical protein
MLRQSRNVLSTYQDRHELSCKHNLESLVLHSDKCYRDGKDLAFFNRKMAEKMEYKRYVSTRLIKYFHDNRMLFPKLYRCNRGLY